MTRLRGRAPRGRRLIEKVPHGHWKTTTFVGALRLEGMTAPMILDGAMHGTAFLAYVEQVLAPTLKRGDIVIMDKVSHLIAPLNLLAALENHSQFQLIVVSADDNQVCIYDKRQLRVKRTTDFLNMIRER